jgi:exopolysaccharide biosynthesis polyprenyl glycosylphosphotransferase
MARSSYQESLILAPRETEAAKRSTTASRYAKLAFGVALTDALCLDAGLLITHVLRTGVAGITGIGPRFALMLIAGPAIWVGIFGSLQLYSLSSLSPATEFRRIIEASALFIGLGVALFFSPGHGILASLSRGWLALAWFLALVLTLVARLQWHKLMGRMRARRQLTYRTLIVGANDEAVRLAEKLETHPHLGFAPVGFVRNGAEPAAGNGLPFLGTIDDLSGVITESQAECLFIASTAVGPEEMKRISRKLRQHDLEVRISANLADILASRLTVQPLGDMLALSLRPVRLTGRQAVTKRAFDLLFGGLGIILSAPIWLVSAALIKLTSRGPVLYRQERVGCDGLPFTIYKFRTMVRGADALRSLLDHRNEASGLLFKMRNDPRVTRVGRWLRRFSIDELPQLINVMKGDMSLVGPRPPIPSEVAQYEDWHRDRLQVRPGITGLWQVGGRSELSFDDYVRLDLFYIENWSVTYDLFLMAKTIPAVVSRRGAF